jgi:ABC-type branched-subunit amino acid transport system permease subunit
VNQYPGIIVSSEYMVITLILEEERVRANMALSFIFLVLVYFHLSTVVKSRVGFKVKLLRFKS